VLVHQSKLNTDEQQYDPSDDKICLRFELMTDGTGGGVLFTCKINESKFSSVKNNNQRNNLVGV